MKNLFIFIFFIALGVLLHSDFFSDISHFSSSSANVASASITEQNQTSSPQLKQSLSQGEWSPANLTRHWQKHKSEFPEYQNQTEYGEGALNFFRSPPSDTQQKTRSNGDRLYYHPPSNTFGVTTKTGVPKTFFRPDNGEKYWRKQ
ncbi:MAG: hypothetical protein LBM70_07400 [Victivallales bacterium]|jgi:pyocin large subunit-like protein|nr:hypothetical protein [Victivallales bacterium]